METDNASKSKTEEGSEFTVSDLMQRFDISLRTLRFYEDQGLLSPRRRGSARVYSNADLVQIGLILKGTRFGMTLSEIKELISARTAAAAPAGSVDESSAADAIMQVARETFGSDEKAWRWFHRPTQAFSGLSPSDVSLAGASGVQKVVDLLKRIDHGLSV